jgi:RND family efflux transporter MFP subunit
VAETPPPPVTVSKPVVRDVINFDEYEGRIGYAEKVEIRARVRGHLRKVNFEDGELVKAGKLLYEIDPREYEANLAAAKAKVKAADAALEYAVSEYKRTMQAGRGGAASRSEMAVWQGKQSIARADRLKADAEVQRAELDLSFTKIPAPIGGKISRTQETVGNVVNYLGSNTLLTTIVAVDPMYVYFNVDERSLRRYKEGYRKERTRNSSPTTVRDLNIPVKVQLDGEQEYPHKGVIDFADNKVNPSTGTMQVRGLLANPDGLFEDGMRAQVKIPIGRPYRAVMVAERAIGTEQGRKFVYVVNKQNVVQQRDVTLGRLFEGLQVIDQGLKGDELVISNGIQRVREGMKVKPTEVPMPGSKQPTSATRRSSKK